MWLLPTVWATLAMAAVLGRPGVADVRCEDVTRQCRVSDDIYMGWRVFHSVCNHCHGQDARGGSFAPDLLASLGSLDYAAFRRVTENGARGRVGVMPGYKDNPTVAGQIEALYAYLRARADGVLPAGRPRRHRDPG